jgi:penicillin-binding protein A
LNGVRPTTKRKRILTRAAPIAIVAVAAFALGLLAGTRDDAPSAGERFAAAWTEDNIEAMYRELTPEARAEFSLERFRRVYQRAARTATLEAVTAGSGEEARIDGTRVEVVPVTVDTHAFGRLGEDLELPLGDDGVAWGPHLAFPGLEPGETLTRRTRAPERAPILAIDGTVLAEGRAATRSLPLGAAAAPIVGEVGTPPPPMARALEARGFPPGSLAGISGLELAYEERLAGAAGGQLLAASIEEEASLRDGRVLAASVPEEGEPLRTTIDPDLQEAAVTALGGLFGGIAVLDARRGAVRALAGIAFTAPQPPGSTFKVITAVAALDAGIVSLEDDFPVETTNQEIGREIRNANQAACGGSFTESFAQSCNTVFAPLGAELGGEELVEAAERFGFNSAPTLHDADATAAIEPPASTLPTELEGDVEAGVSAIGQGEVLATPLQMASMAQTIANGGVRMPTRMVRGDLGPDDEPVRVTSRRTAGIVRDLMVAVVEDGTGTTAALPGVAVAGKTGTAELGPTSLAGGASQEVNAWFAAFAPARDPELAIGVMIVNAEGGGGDVAAPIAREVLEPGVG